MLPRLLRVAGGCAALLSATLALVCATGMSAGRADSGKVDPYLGQPAAIDAGEQIYREKCIICHGKAGGRGPDLFAAQLTDEQFLETVLHGRSGTLMPAFGARLSTDDIWKVRAFVKANPNGI